MDLGAKNRPDERGNILVPGKLAEREHTSRVGRLAIFDDELNWSAEHATRFVHFFSSELCALSFVATGFSGGSSECGYHADFERLRATRQTGVHDHEAGQNDPLVNHPFQHVYFSLGYSRLGELNLVAADGLLRDFSESPVTSVSLEAVRTPLDQRPWAPCKLHTFRLFGVNIKYDQTTSRSSWAVPPEEASNRKT